MFLAGQSSPAARSSGPAAEAMSLPGVGDSGQLGLPVFEVTVLDDLCRPHGGPGLRQEWKQPFKPAAVVGEAGLAGLSEAGAECPCETRFPCSFKMLMT